MTKLILLLFSLLLIKSAFGQDQKLTKLLGADFQLIPARKSIPYMETDQACKLVPSLTIENDTSGIVYQNEFLLFRNYQDSPNGIASYIKKTFVSNSEYIEFQNWVRDSSAREHIIRNTKQLESILKWVQFSETDLEGDRIARSHKVYELKSKHTLNWKTELSYSDPQLMPLLAEMYLPQNERLYKFRDFDRRKLGYRYFQGSNQIDFYTVILNHGAFWANRAHSMNDEYAVLGQVYDQLFLTFPVIGLTGMQAHAFCHWKEVQLQKELNGKKLPYRVRVTLPLRSELTELPQSFSIPEKDYTSQWTISVADYNLFMQAVKDSILLEQLFYMLQDDKETRMDALKLIPYKENYFDEGILEFQKFDPTDYDLSRWLYPLEKNAGVLKKYKDQLKEIERKNQGRLDFYKYDRLDVRSKAIVGEMKPQPWTLNYKPPVRCLETFDIDSLSGEPVGMDLNLDFFNKLGQGNGVRGHENYARFILEEQIAITPEIPIENQKPEDLVKGISYEQALAYYHWKYPIWKAKSGDNWQNFVYPDETQFRQIQNGEHLVVPEHEIQYPTPVFRYVVTFFPAN